MKRVAIVLLVLLVLSGCWAPFGDVVPDYEYEIAYHISGTAPSVSLTYYNSSGSIEQHTGIALPASISYPSYGYWYASILAQNEWASGSVTVEIYHRDTLVQTSTSSGAYVIAMTDYSL